MDTETTTFNHKDFSDFNILPTLSAKLSWSHFIELFPLKSMEAKLFYAKKLYRKFGENEPIALILCAETNKEKVELLELHKDGVLVADFWTTVPPKSELQAKVHQLVMEAKERVARNALI